MSNMTLDDQSVAQVPTSSGDKSAWHHALYLSIGNAALFFVLSFFGGSLGFGVVFNAVIALLFGIGSIGCFFLLLRGGGAFAAISFYVLGAGLLLGFGTAYSTIADDWTFARYFSVATQEEMLPKINLINSVSVLLVLLSALPFCLRAPKRDGGRESLLTVFSALGRMQMPLLLVSVPYIAVVIATFPYPQDLLLRTGLTNFQNLVYFSLVLCGMNWSRSDNFVRFLATSIVISLAWLGLLGLSKTRMLLPIAAFCAGLLLDRKSRQLLIGIAVCVVLGYLLVLADLCDKGRNDPAYDSAANNLDQRIGILERTWGNLHQETGSAKRVSPLLIRFAAAPEQAFLIKAYDNGAKGDSLADAWTALIPRAFWSDKPNITRFGSEFDSLFFRRSHSDSALAPTYTGEAYWNYGWLGVIGVSILVGLEIGWFSRKWTLFTQDGLRNLGILIFSVPTIFFAVWVETWVVANYVGGFVTLVVLILAVDSAPALLSGVFSRRADISRPPAAPKAAV